MGMRETDMNFGDIVILCENQYKYRIDKVLEQIIIKLLDYDSKYYDKFSFSNNYVESYLVHSLFFDHLKFRESITKKDIEQLNDSKNYVYKVSRVSEVLTKEEVRQIEGGELLDIVKQFDVEMNDLGIEGESKMWIDSLDICYISCEYIKDDIIKLVHMLDRYNGKDITLEDNMRYLRNHVYDIAEYIYRYLEMNKRIFKKFDVNGKVFSTYKVIGMIFDIQCILIVDGFDFSKCVLPDEMNFRPKIQTSGEEFIYCIINHVMGCFDVRGKYKIERINNNYKVEVIFNRSDLRGKLIKFSKGVL